MEYQHNSIENKWRNYWKTNKVFETKTATNAPKCYVLDMFPYPSGAGLHVGHPLGYIASDIYARYKKLCGFNVLHPMGYDSFGLPAEQYAIQTGQHPAITTVDNINRYREQLDKIGFSFDWDREIRTSNPEYYKWTQWIFIQLFNSWYNPTSNKAENIETLIAKFKSTNEHNWNNLNEEQQSAVLMEYRLAFLGESYVNWCPQLGTVLANDEVVNGVSERGGYPVERKLMKQWNMRITAYAERLLQGLDSLDWTDSLKESQRNWIGKSKGCSVQFSVQDSKEYIEVFTTRPDTIFGVSFLVVAPEHPLVAKLLTEQQKHEVETYIQNTKNKSERERLADVKTVTGVFTGAYVVHPFSQKLIPVWVGDYVLASYGTGAIMAVPAHDSRDYAFAKTFNLPILPVVEGGNIEKEAYESKEGKIIHSDFITGLSVKEASNKIIEAVVAKNIGKSKTNYKLRDAVFGRQRYWGEPIPVYYKNNIPYTIPVENLPLILPEVDKFLPTEEGEPPLARAENWTWENQYPLETTTMPGWAGSSWYFLRYMDPKNDTNLVDADLAKYWNQVDLYIGGTEHATGHLLYSRFWCKFLYDINCINFDEPFKKLINQGMILGTSSFAYRVKGTQKFISKNLIQNPDDIQAIHVDVNMVKNNELDIEKFKLWREDFKDADFELENGKYICGEEVEKMSKSKFNVVNPDQIVADYGADVLRMYEMFLGPLEQSKPWNTNGIDGINRFIKKVWNLFYAPEGWRVTDTEPSKEELKVMHQAIKKIQEDIENFSFNTSVSAFMICVNELTKLKTSSKTILQDLAVILSPFAPFVCEELWEKLGNTQSITTAKFPVFNPDYLKEDTFKYPVSFNGKTRFTLELDLALQPKEVEEIALNHPDAQKWIEGKTPKKIIVVPGKIINVVV
jgi:leucyl-tRNA synthetase